MMIDSLIEQSAYLPWLTEKLNQIKVRCRHDNSFQPYFLKDLLRELRLVASFTGKFFVVGMRTPSLAETKRAQAGVTFLEYAGIVPATREDDDLFIQQVDDLMGRLRLAS